MSDMDFKNLVNLGLDLAEDLKKDHKLIDTLEVVNDFMYNIVCVKIRFKHPIQNNYLNIPLASGVLESPEERKQFVNTLNYNIHACIANLFVDSAYTTYFISNPAAYESNSNHLVKNFTYSSSTYAITGYTKSTLENNISSVEPDDLGNYLPCLSTTVIHPVNKLKLSLQQIIIHLNDIHRWTREQISDWLESLDLDLQFKTEEDTNE